VGFLVLGMAIPGWFFSATRPVRSHARLRPLSPRTIGLQKTDPPAVPGELLVRFRANSKLKEAQSAELSIESGRKITVRLEQLGGSDIVKDLRLARTASVDVRQAIKALTARPDVLYAEPNYIRKRDIGPNDPRYVDQWALKNTGQLGGLVGADIEAEPAWDLTTGSRSVVVGVVDEGVDINHPDLRDNIWHNPGEIPGNGIDDDLNGFVDDVNGWDFLHNDNTVFDGVYGAGGYQTGGNGDQTDVHGTHVAGVIGANGNNAVGVTGVNWQVSLMSLKFLDSNGGNTANLLRAFSYAKMMRDLWISSNGTRGANLQILNNSYGGANFSQAEFDAIRALNESQILFVAAAGNDHQDNDRFPHYPASYNVPNVVSVAASSRSDAFTSFTNFGQISVDVAAPGADILSTTPNNTYDSFDGTSAAAPHVSGVAALAYVRNPGIEIRHLRAAVLFAGDEHSNFSGTFSGRRLNAYSSLQNATETDSTPPSAISDFRISAQSGRSITLQWTAPGEDATVGRTAAYELRFAQSDISTADQFEQARGLIAPHPSNPGVPETVVVRIPFQHPSGFLAIRALDNVGNAGAITQISFSIAQDISDPYVMSEGGSEALSTGGTPLQLRGDDRYAFHYSLPFRATYFGQGYTSLTISTNGALYLQLPPTNPSPPSPEESGADFPSSLAGLNSFVMIAGLWDDLRTDRRAGDDVYVVTPDSDRIIFRWQGVTFDSRLADGTQRGENPVNFEIELRRNGTVQMRYGAGNQRLLPVVGISGGEPDAYFAPNHTSEAALIDLTNAPSVSFALRKPPPPPSADLEVRINASAEFIAQGQTLTYTVIAHNNGPEDAPNVVLTDTLPAGATFVSCFSGQGTCTGPPPGSTGTVTANIGTLGGFSFSTVPVEIVVQVSAAPATDLVNTATVSGSLPDNNTVNNSVVSIIGVVENLALSEVKAIAAGVDYSAAVRRDGTLWTWGDNRSGQLGQGTRNNIVSPTRVNSLAPVAGVAAGNGFTVANLDNGTVWAWGNNSQGQLGDGTLIDRLSPVQVSGLSGVIAVAVGNFHSVALKDDGTVWTWGAAYALGVGATENSKTPVQLSGLASVTMISARGDHTMALKADGTIWSWGSNANGQLGDGTTTFRSTPVQVVNLTGVTSIAAGGATGSSDHSLAVRNDGTVWAWGDNFHLQIGLPTADFTPHPIPSQVNGISQSLSVSGGGHHSVALRSDGTVWAWGDNNWLQLGYPANCCSAVPGQVSGLVGVQAIAAGSQHNLVLLGDGSLRAWGNNSQGQLGDGTRVNRANPVLVTGLATVNLPEFNPDGGEYSASQNVTISDSTSGAIIRYTTNGVDPVATDPIITSGSTISIAAGRITILKAKAWKAGFIPSAVKTATYTIFVPTNPIDDASSFIRQHYLDFLNREPDQGGWDYWTFNITQCGNDSRCIHNRRIDVSAAFFIELEFQETGYVIYRLHRAAFGTLPSGPSRANLFFARFMTDRSQLVAGPGLAQSTLTFANNFVQRAEFLQSYPLSLSNSEFVNRVFDAASLTPFAAERQEQIAALDGGKTRAQVLLDVTEIPAFEMREYNGAFVLMQYFGYLRRDPDQAGYDFWLGVLNNQELNNYRGMVCAFLTSAEYQRRFGPTITRTDRDCGQ